MRVEDKKQAIELRKSGLSYNEISNKMNISKGTLHGWLNKIILTPEQQEKFQCQNKLQIIAMAKVCRENRATRWENFKQQAVSEYKKLKLNPGFMYGLALYIGEGAKSSPHDVCITNCDYRVIKKSIEFLNIIGVSITDIKLKTYIYDLEQILDVEKFWQITTNLPKNNIKVYQAQVSKASLLKKGNVQKNGTCSVYVCNTELKQKVNEWMNLSLKQ